MPTIQIEAQISGDALLEAALQLAPRELDQFAARLQTLREAGRLSPSAPTGAPVLSQEESTLLLAVNEGLSSDERARFESLVEQRRGGVLSEEAGAELLELTEKSEVQNARRMKALGSLARLRGTTLDGLMKQLGIKAPEVLD